MVVPSVAITRTRIDGWGVDCANKQARPTSSESLLSGASVSLDRCEPRRMRIRSWHAARLASDATTTTWHVGCYVACVLYIHIQTRHDTSDRRVLVVRARPSPTSGAQQRFL